MVAVELRSPIFDEETGEIEWQARALVRADGSELAVYGRPDESIVDTTMRAVDVASGQVVESGDDPEGWARNLPFAYRSGDIVAVVVHDDCPVELDATDEPMRVPSIPAPVQTAGLENAVH